MERRPVLHRQTRRLTAPSIAYMFKWLIELAREFVSCATIKYAKYSDRVEGDYASDYYSKRGILLVVNNPDYDESELEPTISALKRHKYKRMDQLDAIDQLCMEIELQSAEELAAREAWEIDADQAREDIYGNYGWHSMEAWMDNEAALADDPTAPLVPAPFASVQEVEEILASDVARDDEQPQQQQLEIMSNMADDVWAEMERVYGVVRENTPRQPDDVEFDNPYYANIIPDALLEGIANNGTRFRKIRPRLY